MAYITRELLEEYSSKYSEEGAALPKVYASAAEETVARYLRYSPEAREYSLTAWGDGTTSIVLPAPALELLSVSRDGRGQGLDGWELSKNYLYHRIAGGEREAFGRGVRLDVCFRGGWDPVPEKIVTVTLQLASLYWESAGGNIAVSSTSFADSGTRVFNNFQEERLLKEVNEWRIYNV